MNSRSTIVPTDETIFERSKKLANLLSSFVESEDFKELTYEDIQISSNEEGEIDSGGSRKDIKIDFEGSTTSDEFDVNDMLNKTLPVVEERNRKWKESGMDKILDTFDLEAITDKVGSWLKKVKIQKHMSVEKISIVNAQVQSTSDDSLQSEDTAKYILSNRKRRAASCTTMTIKTFCRVNMGKYNYSKHFNINEDLDDVFSKRYPPAIQKRMKIRAMSEITDRSKFGRYRMPSALNQICEESLNESIPKNAEKPRHESSQRQRSRQIKRASENFRKGLLLTSSSSDSSYSQTRHKLRKFSGKSKKSNDTIDSELKPFRNSNQQVCPSKSTVRHNELTTQSSRRSENFIKGFALRSSSSDSSNTQTRHKSRKFSGKSKKSNDSELKPFRNSNKQACPPKSTVKHNELTTQSSRRSENSIKGFALRTSSSESSNSQTRHKSRKFSGKPKKSNDTIDSELKPVRNSNQQVCPPKSTVKHNELTTQKSRCSENFKNTNLAKLISSSSSDASNSQTRQKLRKFSGKSTKSNDSELTPFRNSNKQVCPLKSTVKHNELTAQSSRRSENSIKGFALRSSSSESSNSQTRHKSRKFSGKSKKSNNTIDSEHKPFRKGSNMTCFLPDNIINSTAICNTKQDNLVKTNNCQLSPISSTSKSHKESHEGNQTNESANNLVRTKSIPKTQGSNRQVLVYSPINRRSNNDRYFELNEADLRKSIGEKAAKRYLRFNAKKFPLKFDSSSTVYFKFPTESEDDLSGSSEEDVLEIIGKQGELVEHPSPVP